MTSNIRYDDFIANVHADPAQPEATIMLAGFIGHGAEGGVRIYPDASLGTWYDVTEADVVHAMPVPDAKLGGSYVWVRASAQIKPGAAATGTGAAAAPQAATPPTWPCTLNVAAPVGGWPPSLGCQPSFMACPPAALGAGTVTGFFGCTAACPPAAFNAQTNPPTLGCTGGCNAPVGGWPPSLGCQPSFMACPPAALGAGTVTGFFGCTAACPPAAFHAQTNPPTLGCTGGCNALGAAQTFTMWPLCPRGGVGVFTPFRG
jgi:hypothetical protein